jgi:predicted GIY-YIG superfamily endonuclease
LYNHYALVYVIKLDNDKIYVWITYTFNLRYAQHECGEGAKWTRKHKPIAIIEVVPNASTEVENTKTIEYMKLYGLENVRGGYWCKLDMKNRPKTLDQKCQG